MEDWFEAERHVDRAHEFYERGAWDQAESELREALSLNPYRAEWHFNLGLTLEAAGRHADAAAAFRDAHALEPDDAQTQLLIGVNLLRAGEAREALGWFDTAAKAEPASAAPLVHRIEAYTRLGEHEQAEVMFYMAQQLEPENASAYANLAESLLARDMTDKAIWCLREAAQLDPSLPRVHARLADAYAATGRLERARQLYLLELRQDPGDIGTLLHLGCLLVDMNRLPEAGEKFRRVLELEPDNAEAHFLLADLAERQGLFDEAKGQYGVVLRLDPAFPGGRRRLARLMMNRGGHAAMAEAREMLAEDLSSYREEPQRLDAEDLDELGQLLLDADMPADARTVFQDIVERRPDHAMSLHHLAVACFRVGDRASGTAMSRAALRLDPRFVAAMHNLAVSSVHDGRWMRARYWVKQAMGIDPDDAALRRLRLKLRVRGVFEVTARAWTRAAGALVRPRRAR